MPPLRVSLEIKLLKLKCYSLSLSCTYCFIDSCSWEGHEYRDGVEWTPSPCTKCQCRNGLTECLVAECQPVTCKTVSNHPEKSHLCFMFLFCISEVMGAIPRESPLKCLFMTVNSFGKNCRPNAQMH